MGNQSEADSLGAMARSSARRRSPLILRVGVLLSAFALIAGLCARGVENAKESAARIN